MLVAMSIVASLLPSLPGPITKFSGFPLLLGGLLLGPRTAFAVGCLTDLIGFMLRPTGPFFPGFTLTQGLTALIPALMLGGRNPPTWLKLGDEKAPSTDQEERKARLRASPVVSYLRLCLIFAITQLITSVFLVSYFRSQFVAGTPMDFELTQRAIAQAAHVPVYTFMALGVLKALAETDLYSRLLKARR